MSSNVALNIAIVGGSLCGMLAAHRLRQLGHTVHIFERSAVRLTGRGAGIIVHPDLLNYFEEQGVTSREKICCHYGKRTFVTDKATESASADRSTTSWDFIYQNLFNTLPNEIYHHCKELTEIKRLSQGCEISFADDSSFTCDLLIAADGGNSFCRRFLYGRDTRKFAGYVAWRGLVSEEALDSEVSDFFRVQIGIYYTDHTHILCYMVPTKGGLNQSAKRDLNWVWYRRVEDNELKSLMTDNRGISQQFSVPRGFVETKHIEKLHMAAISLPPTFRELVRGTPDPFIQPIFDADVDRMVFDHALLMGDAAFLLRPHTTSGVYKAFRDIDCLANSLMTCSSLGDALQKFEAIQIPYGQKLAQQSREMGRLDRYVKPVG